MVKIVLFSASLFQVDERPVDFYVQGLRNWCESIAANANDQRFIYRFILYCQPHLLDKIADIVTMYGGDGGGAYGFLAVETPPTALQDIMYGAMWRYLPHYYLATNDTTSKWADVDICISADLDKLFINTVYNYSVIDWLLTNDNDSKRWMIQEPWWEHWFLPEVSGDFVMVKRGAALAAQHTSVDEWMQTMIQFARDNIDTVRQGRRSHREFFYGLDEFFLTNYLWPLIRDHAETFVFIGAPINGRKRCSK